jgi:hypothetical protein
MSTEYWQPVKGYEGLYEVSNQGRVKSLPGKQRSRWGWVEKAGYVRKISLGLRGYPVVDLKHAGRRKTFTVHTLVLTAFVGPKPKGHECRHLNGDRTDSRLVNLAWGTPSENTDDKRRHGTLIQGEKHGASVLSEKDVRLIRRMNDTQANIAKKFNVSQSLISMIKSHTRWTHVQ